MKTKYMMISYRTWDRQEHMREGSNNFDYYKKYMNKENYRIVIKEGRKIIYDEIKIKGW